MLGVRPDTNYENVYYYLQLLELLELREGDLAVGKIQELLLKKQRS
jgi:hypothetical protein